MALNHNFTSKGTDPMNVYRTLTAYGPNIETITPDQAETILRNNPHNRRISATHVAAITRDMIAGNWSMNGASIVISKSGALLDGQHRLQACVDAGVPFTTIVMRGADDEAMLTIDQGRARSIGNHLSIMGVANANTVGSCVRMVAGVATGQLNYQKLTIAESLKVIELHPGISASVDLCRTSVPKCGSLICAMHYIIGATGHLDAADSYAHTMKTGVPSYEGCPIHAARERLMRDAGSQRKMTVAYKHKLMVFASSKLVTGEAVRNFHVPDKPSFPGWTEKELWGNA